MAVQSRRKPSLWRAAMDDVLADGEWHPRSEIVDVGARAVPPSIGYREAIKYNEAQRAIYAKKRGVIDPAKAKGGVKTSYETTSWAGARTLAQTAIGSDTRSGFFETDGPNLRMAERLYVQRLQEWKERQITRIDSEIACKIQLFHASREESIAS